MYMHIVGSAVADIGHGSTVKANPSEEGPLIHAEVPHGEESRHIFRRFPVEIRQSSAAARGVRDIRHKQVRLEMTELRHLGFEYKAQTSKARDDILMHCYRGS